MVTVEKDIEGVTESSLARFASQARKAVGLTGRVDVVVTSNRRMREWNRRFRSKDKPTDVLSFPAGEAANGKFAGDIAISAVIAQANARLLGHSASTEVKILVLHGLLHLAGYDHETDNGRMKKRERQLRRQLRLPEGLIERTVAVQSKTSAKSKPATKRRRS